MLSSPFQRMRARLEARPYPYAVCCMIGSTAAFAAMSACIREASEDLHTTVIVAMRNLLALLVLLPFIMQHGRGILKTTRLKGHFWRATIGIIGMQSWFYCVATLPLNHATALSFTAPLFTTLFAVLFLRENAGRERWLALTAGFLGTVVILRPDPASFEWNSLMVMFTTSIWAMAGLMVKSLTRSEPPLRIIFYMTLFMLGWAIPPALLHWTMPDTRLWALLLAIAMLSTVAHWLQVTAYSLADVVKLMPFDFTRLIFTAIIAYLLFGETSDPTTWLGAAIIIGSAVFIARRDAKAAPVV